MKGMTNYKVPTITKEMEDEANAATLPILVPLKFQPTTNPMVLKLMMKLKVKKMLTTKMKTKLFQKMKKEAS
jgi:hypothetical protein